jgi:hypothetical protein
MICRGNDTAMTLKQEYCPQARTFRPLLTLSWPWGHRGLAMPLRVVEFHTVIDDMGKAS